MQKEKPTVCRDCGLRFRKSIKGRYYAKGLCWQCYHRIANRLYAKRRRARDKSAKLWAGEA